VWHICMHVADVGEVRWNERWLALKAAVVVGMRQDGIAGVHRVVLRLLMVVRQ
jgi:hypothetical protein